jgi:repressor LexA
MKNRDPEYLDKLRDYYAKHRVMPSFSGIAKLVGLKTTSAVAVFVKRMKDLGYLSSSPDRRLQPGKVFFERYVVDKVKAGQPQAANEPGPRGLNIDEYLIDAPARTFLLEVDGDSMIDAGLLPGDTLIVKKNAIPKQGDIVVAVVDGDFTVKFLAKEKQEFYLKPSNKNYSEIRASQGLEVIGVVVGSFRKYLKAG